MQPSPLPSLCTGCPLNRRQFIGRGAACFGASSFFALRNSFSATDSSQKTRIRIVYALHGEKQTGPDWPNKGYDFRPVMDRFNQELTRRFHKFEFLPTLATGEEQAKKILHDDQSAGISGYIVFQMNCWNRVVQTLATSAKPVLYVDYQYGGSGGFLTYTAAFIRNNAPNVGFVASSQMTDLIEAVKCFEVIQRGEPVANFVAETKRIRTKRTHKKGNLACKSDSLTTLSPGECVRQMKQSKILAFRGEEAMTTTEIMGIPLVYLPFSELNAAWAAADQDQAKAVADRWEKTADKVIGVSRETLIQSAAMYLAEKALLAKHRANGVTINCLGGFYGGHIHAYPCLGFHELLNEGLVGGCECDVRSAACLVAFGALAQGRPGYISDPVIDTAKRQIIYAHCVAANRPFGPNGQRTPFQILTHSEDRQGASVRSLLPIGYLTTTVQISGERKEILLHQGKVVANDPDDRACRTKLGVEPIGDLEKLFTQWDQWGWHRVTFYGDLKAPIQGLAEVLGWKVIEEA